MEADILLFMGQSNMAGRGDYRLAPEVLPGAAYEYRAVTEPDTLVPLTEPFGVNENREGGVFEPGMKTGSRVCKCVLPENRASDYRGIVFQRGIENPGMAAGDSLL